MKRLLVTLMFLLSMGFALSFGYNGVVYGGVGEVLTIPIYVHNVQENQTYLLKCTSTTNISCPKSLDAMVGKEKSFDVIAISKLGKNTVGVKFGNEFLSFDVIGSDNTEVFLSKLKNYNETFIRLERTYGEHPLISDAKSLIDEGYGDYEKGDFDAIEGIDKNLASLLSNYYDTLDPNKLFTEETPSRLNFSVIPLLLLVSFALVLYKMPKKKEKVKRTYIEELTSLVKKEDYDVGTR